MPTANNLVRSIFGFSRRNIRPLVLSIEAAYELMFHQGISRNDIEVMKDIYPNAKKEFRSSSYSTLVRRIERLCNQCWDRIKTDEYLLEQIVGNHAKELDEPSEVIFLLACYMRYEKPFREVLEQESALTF